jgi:hypothetical protein
MVAEWLTHSAATVTASHSINGRNSEFISDIDTVMGTKGLEMVCVALQNVTVNQGKSGDNW